MLVLSRKKSEEIKVGDDVVIKIISIGPSCVKIGIDAPPSVPVIRKELEGVESKKRVCSVPGSDRGKPIPTTPSHGERDLRRL